MLEKIKEIAEITKSLQLKELHFFMWWCFMDKRILIVSFLKKEVNSAEDELETKGVK